MSALGMWGQEADDMVHMTLAFDTDPLMRACDRARAVLDLFARMMQAAQEGEYLTAHRRLPGSTRTKRLRKKRVDRVSAWWRANV